MLSIYITIVYFLAIANVSTLATFGETDFSYYLEAVNTQKPCNYGQGEIVELGLEKNLFFPVITICRDTFNTDKIYWSKHTLTTAAHCSNLGLLEKIIKLIYKGTSYLKDKDVQIAFLSPLCDFDSDTEKEVAFMTQNHLVMNKVLYRQYWEQLENNIRYDVKKNVSDPVKIITGGFDWSSKSGYLGQNYDYANYVFKIVVRVNSEQVEVYVAANDDKKTDLNVCNTKNSHLGEGRILLCELDGNLLRRMGLEKEDLEF